MRFFIKISFIFICVVVFLVNYQVINIGGKYIRNENNVPKSDAIVILGAYVFPDGKPSDMLKDRLDLGLKLYKSGKAPRIIVSGDHGTTAYDEVNMMRSYLQTKGVKREAIFMDHAGFDTYDTMYRAKNIFLVKKAIIVTQDFHLTRALYIANNLGLESYGVSSDLRKYHGITYNYAREIASRIKAFLQVSVFHSKPKCLGKKIPIYGNGVVTDNGKT